MPVPTALKDSAGKEGDSRRTEGSDVMWGGLAHGHGALRHDAVRSRFPGEGPTQIEVCLD